MLKFLYLFMVINPFNAQKCNENCLKCSSKKECLICDYTKHYFYQNGLCIQIQKNNCIQQDSKGACVRCEKDYYLESTRNECIKMDPSKMVENCIFYNTFENCDTCANRHYIEDNKCIRAVADIDNCKYLLSDTTCRECNEGYLLSVDQLSCEQVSESNCLFYSRIACNKCVDGYYPHQNYYFENFKFDQDSQRNLSMKYLSNFNGSQLQLSQKCRKIEVTNCLVYKNYKECEECDVESYLDENNQCKIKPVPSITNCLTYSTDDICQECQSNYYKENDKSCVPVNPVQFCSKYDGTSDITQCLECQGGFYLVSQNKCQKRINIDAQCKEYQEDRDKCKTCNDGYTTIDQIRCFTKVKNCQIHKQTDPTYLECEKCEEGYHPDGRQCTQGTIDKCEKYTSDSNYTSEKCEKCQNQYFIVEVNQKYYCESIKKIDECVIYKGTMDKHCQTCSHSYYPFIVDKKCKDYEGVEVPNCIEYHLNLQNKFVCKTCPEKYYLNEANNKCTFITNFDDCIKLSDDNTQCIKCKEGKILFDSQCQDSAKYVQEYCSEMDTYDGIPFNQNCKKCIKNTIPKEMKDHVICHQKSLNLFDLIEECEIYSLDANQNPICHRCSSNKRYLKDNTCVSQCEEDEYVSRLDGNKINVCKKLLMGDRCKLKVLNKLRQEVCVECGEDDLKVVNTEINWQYSSMNKSVIEDLVTDPFKQLVPVKCIEFVKNVTRINGIPYPDQKPSTVQNHQKIAQCEYYVDAYGTQDYYCIKCIRSALSRHYLHGYINQCNQNNSSAFENEKQIFNQVSQGIDNYYEYFINNYDCQEGFTKVINFFSQQEDNQVRKRLLISADLQDNITSLEVQVWLYEMNIMKMPKFQTVQYPRNFTTQDMKEESYFYIQNSGNTGNTGNTPPPTPTYDTDQIVKILKNKNILSGQSQNIHLRGQACIKNKTQHVVTIQQKYSFLDKYKKEGTDLIDMKKLTDSKFLYILQNCGVVGVFYPGKLFDNIQHPPVNYTNNADEQVQYYRPIKIQSITSNLDSRSYCLYCKPKFTPKGYFKDGDMKFIYACVEIQNCKSSTWYNKCSQCIEKHVWPFANNQINYSQCISIDNHENCYAGNADGCELCQKSYVLNKDKKCVKEDAGYCQDTTSIFTYSIDWQTKISQIESQLTNDNFFYNLYYKKDFWGCQKCKDDSISILLTNDKTLCTKMEYLENFSGNEEITATTNYIKNCLIYTFDSLTTLKCEECNSPYTLTDQHQCKQGTENCQLLKHDDLEHCIKCKTAYSRVNNKCQVGGIDNCIEQDNESNSENETCKKCDDGYYLSNSKQQCNLSKVEMCKEGTENNEFKCDVCKENYGLIQRGSKDYCYPLLDTKCKEGTFAEKMVSEGSTESTGYYEFKCSKCKEIYYQQISINTNPTDFQGKTMCMKHLSIDNCKLYYNFEMMNDKNFQCKECNDKYYLDQSENICKIRNYYEEDKCKTYDLYSDKCEECKENYILGEDVEQCKFIPDGLSGCYIYQNKYKCKKCFENHYLSESANCIKVADQSVENCIYYKDANTCEECATNYFLNTSRNECQLSSIPSCKVYSSVESCKECDDNFGLIKSNNELVCVPLEDHNCLVHKKVENSPCIRCKENFFPDSNSICQPVQEPIDNCKYYKSSTLCDQCLPETVRSLDQSKCLDRNEYISFISLSCESSIETEPFCSFCQFGYYFKEGKCQKCILNSQEQGCMQCDPNDNEKCILCLPGYHMNERFLCISNSQQTTDDDSTPVIIKQVKILKILCLIFILILN